MSPLRAELDRGPRPAETIDQFAEHLIGELEENLERFVPYRPHKRGRRPKTLGTGRRMSKTTGRPRKYDLAAIVLLVEERIATASEGGRRLTRPAALREQFAEEMRTNEPDRYRVLQKLQRQFEEVDSLSPERALCRAFNHPKIKSGLPNYRTLARQLSFARTGRRRAHR